MDYNVIPLPPPSPPIPPRLIRNVRNAHGRNTAALETTPAPIHLGQGFMKYLPPIPHALGVDCVDEIDGF